jgi:uncharacterized tellurite resistance protein B-like protein
MACDGNIADEEVSLLKNKVTDESIFKGLDAQAKISEYVKSINEQKQQFLKNYITEVKKANLDDDSALQLIKIAIDTIEADHQIEYSEISFFKKIRRVLSISDEKILEAMPDKEEYILPDIEDDFDDDWNVTFDKIQVVPISQLNI